MIMYSGGICGVRGRWAVSAPTGNKGHLFNLRRGGSLQPAYRMRVCCYSACCKAHLLALCCIHYTRVVGNLTVSIGFPVDGIITEVTGCWWAIQALLIILWIIGCHMRGSLWTWIRKLDADIKLSWIYLSKKLRLLILWWHQSSIRLNNRSMTNTNVDT